MDFEKRLQQAIQRGQREKEARGRREAAEALSEEQLRRLHSQYRLALAEHIEQCLRKLAEHFPGFRFETVMRPEGWGAQISRDDLRVDPGRRRRNEYSRLLLLVKPFSEAHLLELSAKATVRNKEIFNRSHYQFLSDADLDSFREVIDLWVLEFAEKYAASR
ncbi:MAG: hypothetical protein D6725_16245 [Planctomycetota bacterium]|nr:MAG: hypothetical protein D6725_16245 [Planctomycetota bacterium]